MGDGGLFETAVMHKLALLEMAVVLELAVEDTAALGGCRVGTHGGTAAGLVGTLVAAAVGETLAAMNCMPVVVAAATRLDRPDAVG